MEYISTRGRAPALSFKDMLFEGLATDGGLYTPATWPRISPETLRAWRRLSYQELAAEVMLPFVDPDIHRDDLAPLLDRAYAGFRSDSVAPLCKIDDDVHLLELFHGPTYAFKDFAMQLLAQVFEFLLVRESRTVTVIGATSGDTGAAAIEAFRDLQCVNLFILFPLGRISEVQRRQMTMVQASNIHVIGIPGTFDDCQRIVKEAYGDEGFREAVSLTSVNSINWARIMAQAVYYFWAGLRLGAPDQSLDFAIPTGNFGNAFAGHVARQMGLPINRLLISSNRNDILTRFFRNNDMSVREVATSLSPSMDIQISSNFERLLFELCDRDATQVQTFMAGFHATGAMPLPAEVFERTRAGFDGFSLDDEAIVDAMRDWQQKTGTLIDPHTVIAMEHARLKRTAGHPAVALSTAHPAKFPEAVSRATGNPAPLPQSLAQLMGRPENAVSLPNNTHEVRQWIRERLASVGGMRDHG